MDITKKNDYKVYVATEMILRNGVIAAEAGGETSAGHQALITPTPREIAERACGIAASLAAEIEKRGWITWTEE